ncbi:MAG: hypothetical protein H0U59_14045 [Gemmatimonadaceae bacterium]|nr:hypothetical protein [Gemmatimonadaceae bacterium]
MDENKVKLKVLGELMSHMRSMDGARLKPPKAVEVEAVEMKPTGMDVSEEDAPEELNESPEEEKDEDDLSDEELKKLQELYNDMKA